LLFLVVGRLFPDLDQVFIFTKWSWWLLCLAGLNGVVFLMVDVQLNETSSDEADPVFPRWFCICGAMLLWWQHTPCMVCVCAACMCGYLWGAYLVLVQNSYLTCLPYEARHGCACLSWMVNYFDTATCNSGCPNSTDFTKLILVTS
jgi:hypothetical protein